MPKDETALGQALEALQRAPRPGDLYQHYKGGHYIIVCSSLMEDTLEPMVTYRSMKQGSYWTRTLENLTEPVKQIGIDGSTEV